MSLAIVPGDMLTQISNVFYSIWPILSIGLALLAAPFIIKITQSIFEQPYQMKKRPNWYYRDNYGPGKRDVHLRRRKQSLMGYARRQA